MSYLIDKKCDWCFRICKKTKFGSCVILCKENIRLCMDCYFVSKDFEFFKRRNHLIKYLKNREIGLLKNTTKKKGH